MDEAELLLRRMRYRLNRQGMLELDAWLTKLFDADFGEPDIAAAVSDLLHHEAPELQAMMHGEIPIPNVLRPWLSCN